MADNIRKNIQVKNTKLNDAVEGIQQAKYLQRGLTYISNNDSVIPRDAGGNIVLNEGSDTNPLLLIDPVAERITMQSALKVLDTRFQYYKFPVTINAEPIDTNFNIDILQDPIYARYKPSENRFINAGGIPSGILMDELVEGIPQANTNAYYITKEIKNSGVDIRIRAKISHYFIAASGFGTSYFTLYKSGPNYPINRFFRPGPDFAYTSTTTTNPYDPEIVFRATEYLNKLNSYCDSAITRLNLLPDNPAKTLQLNHFSSIKSRIPSNISLTVVNGYRIDDTLIQLVGSPATSPQISIVLVDLQNDYVRLSSLFSAYASSVIQANQFVQSPGQIAAGETQILYIDEVIQNSEFEIGDSFGIAAFAGQAEQHTIFSEQTYMVVTDASKNVDEWNQPVN